MRPLAHALFFGCVLVSAGTFAGTTDPQPFVQDSFDEQQNGVRIFFGGNNSNSVGLDYDMFPYKADGTVDMSPVADPSSVYKPNHVDPMPTANGYSYTAPAALYTGGPLWTYEKYNGLQTGNVWQVQTVNGVQKWAKTVPAITIPSYTAGWINGTLDIQRTGIVYDKMHTTEQLMGGQSNKASDPRAELDALINSAKASANYEILTGLGGNAPLNLYGSPDSPVVVWAHGTKNPDGTINEGKLSLTTTVGWGILIVEVDDPAKGGLVFAGTQSRWTGLVIVVANKTPNGTGQDVLDLQGSDQVKIVGGAYVYMRNQKRTGEILLTDPRTSVAKLAGNGSILFSNNAINMAFRAKPTSVVVRSWRKLAENE
ncbi:MAG TPA: hypothetical protein VEK08_16285 [Planctomycetota bacterium]|nr:hypothetical protein [Planctomycetota bacterium]